MSRLHGKMRPRLGGLPYLLDRATRLGGLPHLSCKHDQIKMRDYMERRVTSPTWGPPPPCKQALKQGQGTRGRAAPSRPGIYRVPPRDQTVVSLFNLLRQFKDIRIYDFL